MVRAAVQAAAMVRRGALVLVVRTTAGPLVGGTSQGLLVARVLTVAVRLVAVRVGRMAALFPLPSMEARGLWRAMRRPLASCPSSRSTPSPAAGPSRAGAPARASCAGLSRALYLAVHLPLLLVTLQSFSADGKRCSVLSQPASSNHRILLPHLPALQVVQHEG